MTASNDNNILTNDKLCVTVEQSISITVGVVLKRAAWNTKSFQIRHQRMASCRHILRSPTGVLSNEVCMKLRRGSTVFLKGVIVLIAIVVLAGMIRFPQTEGRATNLDLISIYTDPLIIYGYIASIPFFFALYQAFKLLGHIDTNSVFSQLAVNAVRNIKYCALIISGFIVLGVLYIILFAHGDDPAGPTALGIVTTFASLVIATAAALFERLLQNAIDIKSENDLTV
jgi:hypothetical protein